jgi:hypothetical protein
MGVVIVVGTVVIVVVSDIFLPTGKEDLEY